jgi:hypothetical protein
MMIVLSLIKPTPIPITLSSWPLRTNPIPTLMLLLVTSRVSCLSSSRQEAVAQALIAVSFIVILVDEAPAGPPPSHVATDDELRALEREIFDYGPSVDGSGYTTDTDADADSEMSDIPSKLYLFPLHAKQS